jgi:uncharacterized phage protein gp47/JayE
MDIAKPVLPVIDYTSRDYAAIREDMIRAIRVRIPQWTADNPSDFGLALVEAYAYGIDILNYYLDRVANEAYLDTAVQRESLYSIAKMFAYTPRQAEAARVELTFTNSTPVEIALAAGTRCQATTQSSDGVIVKNFETVADTVVPPQIGINPSFITVPAVEGRTYRDETIGVSTGFVSQQYLLPRTSVLPWTVTITTEIGSSGVVEWSERADLSTSLPEERVFQVIRQTDGSSIVRFGDAVHGAIPDLHSIIRATYRVGGGTSGNVATGTVTAVVDPVIYGLSVSNESPATGGINEESLNSIRSNAAKSFLSRDRAVTLLDYVTVAENAPGIAKAKAVWNNGSSVTLYVVPDADEFLDGDPITTTLDDSQRLSTIAYVEDRATAGVSVSVFGPVWRTFYVKMKATLEDSAKQSEVRAEIQRRLQSAFDFQQVGFDSYVSAGDVYNAVAGTTGLKYAEVEAISFYESFPETSTETLILTDEAINAVQYWSRETSLQLTMTGGIS